MRPVGDDHCHLPAKLLTLDEACECLGITEKTLLQHVRAGRLPYIDLSVGVGRKNRRFHPEDLARFIDQRRTFDAPPLGSSRSRSAAGPTSHVIDFTEPRKSYDISRVREARKEARAAALAARKAPTPK